jgi:malate dehydrogenase (oxaloacetate-decarboxylating)(NADP+)
VDLDAYRDRLESRLGKAREIVRFVIRRARHEPKRIVFPEGEHPKVLRASQNITDEGFAQPILLGDEGVIRRAAEGLGVDLDGARIVQPGKDPRYAAYVDELYRLRQRKGVTLVESRDLLLQPMYFASMMVRAGDADALVAGVSQHYPDTIRPALQVIGKRDDVSRVAGLFPLVLRDKVYFFADPLVNIEPTAEQLADIAILSAEEVRRFDIEPKVAMISFSNFGSAKHPLAEKVRRATELLKQRAPALVADGEMQADTALSAEILAECYPFSALQGGANILVFPDLQSANAAYKLVLRLAQAEAIGPILMGMRKPVHLLQHGMEVKDIVSAAALAVVEARDAEPAPQAPRLQVARAG